MKFNKMCILNIHISESQSTSCCHLIFIKPFEIGINILLLSTFFKPNYIIVHVQLVKFSLSEHGINLLKLIFNSHLTLFS